MNSREQFLKLLREDILKFDLAKLDFGIYRVLNYRREEIEAFLNEQLPQMMTEAVNHESKNRLEVESTFTQTEEEHLYNHLYTFFSRYYRDGDFFTQTRRGREAKYMVPYNGEDVHFHWKTWGSHYVKTSEELKTYACRLGSWRVVFELSEASQEKDNVKGQTRYFFPLPKQIVASTATQTLTLPFVFRPLTEAETKKYNGSKKRKTENEELGNGLHTVQERILKIHLETLQPNLPLDVTPADLFGHMRRYTRKNRTDYFVHRHLGKFLKEEFDYYLKQEFLNLEALLSPEFLQYKFLKLRVLREIGHAISSFLDQLESFQARLFEKRKFVLSVDYLIPVRLLPPNLIPQILHNAEQLQAWLQLFGLKGSITEETLQAHPTLVVDTRHFDVAFKQQIMANFNDIDKLTDGVLIKAENYAALRTIEAKYKGKLKVIYIDPPYNTGSDGFLYKDDFSRHSTWLTMMEERLRLAHSLLNEGGVLFVSIDDIELGNLLLLIESIFGKSKSGKSNSLATFARRTKSGGGSASDHFAVEHDYVLAWAKDKDSLDALFVPYDPEYAKRYNEVDDDGSYYWDTMERSSTRTKPYKIKAPDGTLLEGKWFRSESRFKKDLEKGDVRFLKKPDGTWSVQFKQRMPKGKKLRSLLAENEFKSNQSDMQQLGLDGLFDHPKPVKLISSLIEAATPSAIESDLVLDFFAGSGTTGEAVINLNRSTNGQRKFVLVEMGNHFDRVLASRIQKIMYAPEWRHGKPIFPTAEEAEQGEKLPAWIERSPRLVKVLRLESYEDSLNALELPKERDIRIQRQLELFSDLLCSSASYRSEFLLKYLLPTETEHSEVLLNTKALETPFNYSLRLYTPEGRRNVPVDLVETFNLLMGFHVQRIHELTDQRRRYVVVEALENNAPVMVVWRDVPDLDPERERQFLAEKFELSAYTKIYTNADNALPKGTSLDAVFKRLMNEPEKRTP